MKKIILISIGLIVLATTAYFAKFYFFDTNQKSKTEVLREKRKGYNELKIFEASYKFGIPDPETKKMIQYVSFDKLGNTLTEEFFSIDNKKKTFYSYDPENKLIKKTEYNFDNEEIILNIYYIYDGNLLTETNTLYPKDSSTITRIYDMNENETSYTKYTKDSNIIERSSTFNEYNDKKQLIEQRELITSIKHSGSAYDSLINITSYIYDKNILTEFNQISIFNKNEPSIYFYKLNYNDNALLIEKIQYDKSGTPLTILTYEYK